MQYLAVIFCLGALLFANSMASAQTVTTLVGDGTKGFSGDGGPADKAQLDNVYGVARGPDGQLYLCDMGNHRIRRVSSDGIIETYVGSGEKGYAGDGGPAKEASLNEPFELAWDKAGNLYFVEVGNHVVRRVDAKTGIITTIAGDGTKGLSGDQGPAVKAKLNAPHSLAFGPSGHLYVCDIGNNRIRRIDAGSKAITTWAGPGPGQAGAEGLPLASTSLPGPRAIVFTPEGICWLALREGNALIKIDLRANRVDKMASLSGPKGIALDAAGRVYIADTESHSIRYYDEKAGGLRLLVGDGEQGDGPDGDPLHCRLARPHGVFVDSDGSVLIGDSENNRIRVWRKK
jgi:streptogramin lyase